MQVSTVTQASLDKAKIGIFTLANSIFISTILFSLRLVWTDKIPTAATNGRQLKINPEFWDSLDHAEQVFLLLHEAWHVAFEHLLRVGNRNPMIWNMACDYVINAMLIKQGLKMPKGGLYDAKYLGWQVENVYDELIKNPPPEPQDFMSDLEAPSDEETEALAEELKDTIIKAAIRSEMGGDEPGSIPGEIQRWIDQILNPKLPWNVILQNYMYELVPDDYTFRKFNRRFLPQVYLPSLMNEGLDKVALLFDTSGSVTPDQLKEFATETYHIVAQLKPKRCTMMSWDWNLYEPIDVHSVTDIYRYPFNGGGGTDINPVIEWIEREQPDVAIIFTDGQFHLTAPNPNTHIVWAIHSNDSFQAPYGRIVNYPL